MSFLNAIKDVEDELNIVLPQDYINFLKNEYENSLDNDDEHDDFEYKSDFLSIDELKTGQSVLKRYNLFKNMTPDQFSLEDYRKQLIISDIDGCCIVIDTRENGNGVYLLFPNQQEVRVVIVQNEQNENAVSILALGGELRRKFANFTEFYNWYILC